MCILFVIITGLIEYIKCNLISAKLAGTRHSAYSRQFLNYFDESDHTTDTSIILTLGAGPHQC